MAKRRYAWASIEYRCLSCGNIYILQLEEGIEGHLTPSKPAPHTIKCPFCKNDTPTCGKEPQWRINRVCMRHRRIHSFEPYLANIAGKPEGVPVHMEFARAERRPAPMIQTIGIDPSGKGETAHIVMQVKPGIAPEIVSQMSVGCPYVY